jgi:hypothetical protein
LDEQAAELLEHERHRATWDEPVNSVGDIEALSWLPRTLNFKPARFDSVRRLLDAYD